MKEIQKQDKSLEFIGAIARLKDQGANYIVCEFYGGGDSGGIEDVVAYDKLERFGDKKDIMSDDVDVEVGDVEDVCIRYMEDYDWWNNEGGSGYFSLNLHTLEYICDYCIAYTTYDDYQTQNVIKLK